MTPIERKELQRQVRAGKLSLSDYIAQVPNRRIPQGQWPLFFCVLALVGLTAYYTAPLWLMLVLLPQKFWIGFWMVVAPILIAVAKSFDKRK